VYSYTHVSVYHNNLSGWPFITIQVREAQFCPVILHIESSVKHI
jgi:hypothetical protein